MVSTRATSLKLKISAVCTQGEFCVSCVCRIAIIFQNSINWLEIKCQLDATEVFIADLIACSTCFGQNYAHHQEL